MSLFSFTLSFSVLFVHRSMANSSGCTMTGSGTIKCDSKYECQDEAICLTDGYLFNCGDEWSCLDASVIVSSTVTDFYVEMTGEYAGASVRVDVSCNDGQSLKGVKCGNLQSCGYARITYTGDCDLEKVECDGYESCKNAAFHLNGGAEVGEFICGGTDSCVGCEVYEDGVPAAACSDY